MTDGAMGFLLGVLAVWRLTHLFTEEDGPFDLVLRLRRRLGHGALGDLLDCFYCLSLWIAVPFAFFLGAAWGGGHRDLARPLGRCLPAVSDHATRIGSANGGTTMSCCGKKRAEWLHQARREAEPDAPGGIEPPPAPAQGPRAFEYTGHGERVMKGLHSGRAYHFRRHGDVVLVEHADSFALLAESELRLRKLP